MCGSTSQRANGQSLPLLSTRLSCKRVQRTLQLTWARPSGACAGAASPMCTPPVLSRPMASSGSNFELRIRRCKAMQKQLESLAEQEVSLVAPDCRLCSRSGSLISRAAAALATGKWGGFRMSKSFLAPSGLCCWLQPAGHGRCRGPRLYPDCLAQHVDRDEYLGRRGLSAGSCGCCCHFGAAVHPGAEMYRGGVSTPCHGIIAKARRPIRWPPAGSGVLPRATEQTPCGCFKALGSAYRQPLINYAGGARAAHELEDYGRKRKPAAEVL